MFTLTASLPENLLSNIADNCLLPFSKDKSRSRDVNGCCEAHVQTLVSRRPVRTHHLSQTQQDRASADECSGGSPLISTVHNLSRTTIQCFCLPLFKYVPFRLWCKKGKRLISRNFHFQGFIKLLILQFSSTQLHPLTIHDSSCGLKEANVFFCLFHLHF